ncbi:MAG: copper resistance protein CopC, partial [Phycisphaerales bacterium]|nr:copper resistance protein CopC [Phycisphaerales bacterium]
LVADSDCNGTGLSTVWSLSNILGGGDYNAVGVGVSCATRLYGDLDFEPAGSFGGIAYVTEKVTDEIQQVAPDGTHTTWATGFVGIDSLSISPDGESMYVADLNGVWLIRPDGNEPGPALVCHDPSSSGGTVLAGGPVSSARLIFSEPVSFDDSDVTVTDADGLPVGFDASGSVSQFMIIGFVQPLDADVYTISVADTVTAVATGQALDGDNDGVAGGTAQVVLTHRCAADVAEPGGLLDLADVNAFVGAFLNNCE